jgi:AraC-like DNA-binding protein
MATFKKNNKQIAPYDDKEFDYLMDIIAPKLVKASVPLLQFHFTEAHHIKPGIMRQGNFPHLLKIYFLSEAKRLFGTFHSQIRICEEINYKNPSTFSTDIRKFHTLLSSGNKEALKYEQQWFLYLKRKAAQINN